MEAAGIGFAAFSILGLTKATKKLVRTMWIVFRDKDGNILAEIDESVNRLETNSGVIETAVQALKRYEKKYPRSAVIRDLTRKGTIKGIGREARALKRKMSAVESRIKTVRRIREFQWVIRIKAKVDALIPDTTSVQCLLQLAMILISQDVMRSLPPAQDDKVTEFMQELFKQKQEEAENRSSELERLSAYSLAYTGQYASDRSHLRKLQRLARDMLTLADEFDKARSVPLQGSSESSAETTNSAIYESNSSLSDPVSLQPISSPTPSLSGSNFYSDSPQPFSSLSSLPKQTGSESMPSSPSIMPIELARSQNSPVPSESLSSSSKGHKAIEDYFNVRPTPRELSLDRRKDRDAVSGFIGSDESRKDRIQIIARRDVSLAENLISLRTAQQHNLVIEEEDGLERVIFENNSSTAVLGKVARAFVWMQGNGRPIRIKVSLWVCEHLRESIILGKPFHDRETHSRKERDRS